MAEFKAELPQRTPRKFEAKNLNEDKPSNDNDDGNNMPTVPSLTSTFDAQCARLPDTCVVKPNEAFVNPTDPRATNKRDTIEQYYKRAIPQVESIFQELKMTGAVSIINASGELIAHNTLKPNEIAVAFPGFKEVVFTYYGGNMYSKEYSPVKKNDFIKWVKQNSRN